MRSQGGHFWTIFEKLASYFFLTFFTFLSKKWENMRLKRIFGIFENVLFPENDIFSFFTLFGLFWRQIWAQNDVTVPPLCPSC